MIDATRQMRFYVGLFMVMCGFLPVLMFTLLASQAEAAENELVPVLIGAPVNAVALVFLIWGMWAEDPRKSTRRILIGAGLVVVGNALLYGLRAVLV